jgi:hypothetical protein
MMRPKYETNSAIACTVATSTLKVTLSPRENDIVFGRGKTFQDHAGNKRMRECVMEYKHLYIAIKRFQKHTLVQTIYEKLLDGGARFLRRDDATDSWVIVDRDHATQKVSHALRCKKHLKKPSRSTKVEKIADPIMSLFSQSKTAAVKTLVNEAQPLAPRSIASLSRSTVAAPTLQTARMPPFGPLVSGNRNSFPDSDRTFLALENLRLHDNMVRHQQLLAMLNMERQVQDQAASFFYNSALNQYLGLRK